jgi:MerR family mercuric resistance operon transcriptional regulator
MQALTIGEVAKAARVGVETIRFYEREGLIADPPRRRSGYRQYPPDTVRRVRFIRRAKDLGFTLKEISELLSLRVVASTTCADVRSLARAKIADIDRRIDELGKVREALERLARRCRGQGPTTECPILDALDEGGPHDDG